jgi:hypothetical protein
MKIYLEMTDTFGGEANYSWVRRAVVECGKGTRLSIVRAAKAWAGWTGWRAETTDFGDMIDIRPAGVCQLLFITFEGGENETISG